MALLAVAPAEQSQPLLTRWSKRVNQEHPHGEYPRPQMVRAEWLNLNGKWNFEKNGSQTREILVPFPPESYLSGIREITQPEDVIVYSRSFDLPRSYRGKRILLHFGAVDWRCEVFINRQRIGEHLGGYAPFSFDITDALSDGERQEIKVVASDPTDKGTQPRGKQVLNPSGIWYTPTSGIWQTVWLEPVPMQHIRNLRIQPDIDANSVSISADFDGEFTVRIFLSGRQIGEVKGKQKVTVPISHPILWTPENPALYDLEISAGKDKIRSYFAMRKISLGKDDRGRTRVCLNNKPYFMIGTLDQGFWPDGIYTAPTDQAMLYDIEVLKKLGFNCLRKHVKVEPDRYYYWCDKLGMLVWQDMPSGDGFIGGSDPDLNRTPRSATQYRSELTQIIEALRNHPCIVIWVPFNEGWGQFETAAITEQIRKLDPSRLVDSASGWTDRKTGDMHDWHVYPGPGSPNPEPDRAAVLGEFGGLGLALPGHLWHEDKNWGYRTMKDRNELTSRLENLMWNVRLLQAEPGLSAAIYTQTTDVENEVNGLMTYDRELIKPDAKRLRAANLAAAGPPPVFQFVVPCAATGKNVEWRYSELQPASDWMKPKFDDSSWKLGIGGFGTQGTPGAIVGTVWSSSDIWLRREFVLNEPESSDLYFWIHHDEDAVIYLDGVPVVTLNGYTTSYVSESMPASARKLLSKGKHTLAIHCKQTTGGQYIDAGIVKISK
jgi:hypothetical protein